MGFKYVFIPASPNDPMQELEYGTDIDDLQKDTFRDHITEFYSAMAKSVDRSVLFEQLKARTGVDVAEKAASGDMPEDMVQRMLQSTSVEIFPVQLPTAATGFEGISAYVDDKGVAKELEENPRVTGLVQACGFPTQTFRGDIFIGRIIDNEDGDVWKRVDFTLRDCDSGADWVAKTKKQRTNKSSGDMKSLADKMGVGSGAAHINPAMMDQDATPKGETAQYAWRQQGEDVEITFKKEGLQAGDKKQVKVVFGKTKLKVEAKGEVLIDAALGGQVEVDDCTWTLSDGVLQVTMAKANEETWTDLLKK